MAIALVDRDGGRDARMRQRLAVVVARAARAVRGLWPDRNPLRRTIDRLEAAIVGGLAVAFLAGAPLAAAAAAHAAYSYGGRGADWHRVPAVLLATAPTYGYAGYQPMVPARWIARNGMRRTGAVPAPPGVQAGGTVMVWVDAAGHQTGPPLPPVQVRSQAALAALLAPLIVGMIMLWAGQLAHGVLDRRRLAGWDAAWRATEPQWTRRH
jgi:hypothetical protein